MSLLTNKKYQINGHWYSPREFLQNIPSITKVELTDTTSSAGDWNGYFIQKHNGYSYLILFSQENNWPKEGFTLYTNEFPSVKIKGNLSKDAVNDYFNFLESYEPKENMEEDVCVEA